MLEAFHALYTPHRRTARQLASCRRRGLSQPIILLRGTSQSRKGSAHKWIARLRESHDSGLYSPISYSTMTNYYSIAHPLNLHGPIGTEFSGKYSGQERPQQLACFGIKDPIVSFVHPIPFLFECFSPTAQNDEWATMLTFLFQRRRRRWVRAREPILEPFITCKSKERVRLEKEGRKKPTRTYQATQTS